MFRHLAATLLLLSFGQGVSAQEDERIEAFNLAWASYLEAAQSGEAGPTIEAAREVLDIGTTLLPADDERIAVLTQNYGSALLADEQNKLAREQLELALSLYEAKYGKNSMELITVLGELADANGGVGEASRQMRFYKRALRITVDHHGDSSPEYGALAFRAARNIYVQSHSPIGKKYMEAAQKIFLTEFGASDVRVGLTHFYLGKMRFSQRQYKQAATNLEAALPSFEGDSVEKKSLRLVTRALLVQAYETHGKSDLATPHCIAIGSESQFSPDQDYKPIFRLAPQYPGDLLVRGIEGYVDVSFTIDENGFVQDPVVFDSEPGRIRDIRADASFGRTKHSSFEKAALDVVERFRYAPRFVDGEAVAVDGVKTRISFELVD